MCRRLLCLSFLLFACASASARPRWQACLPDGVKAEDVVSAEQSAPGGPVKRVTVAARLKQLSARCRGGKLIGAKGREIKFYRLTGCWGNAPANYTEIMERQRKEIADLKKRYIVVEMTCNPSGQPIP